MFTVAMCRNGQGHDVMFDTHPSYIVCFCLYIYMTSDNFTSFEFEQHVINKWDWKEFAIHKNNYDFYANNYIILLDIFPKFYKY